MENTESAAKPMGAMGRVINIFTSPKEALVSIDQKPTWLVPYLIGLVFVVVMMVLTADIQSQDRLAIMQAQEAPEQQIQATEAQMGGPLKYIGIPFAAIGILVVWAIIAGLLLLASNLMMGGAEVNFKKVFSIIAWSSIVGVIGTSLITFLAMQKGTMLGVSTDLSVLLTNPPLGEEKSVIHRLLGRLDLFVFWQMILWVIGLSVAYKSTIQKAIMPVLTLWIVWVIIAVSLGAVLGKFIPGL